MCIARSLILVIATVSSFLIATIQTAQDTSASCGSFERYSNKNEKCIDYEWCLYKFYTQTKSWFDAKAICKKENMTLAHITTDSQYTYLSNLMKSTLTTLFANPPSSVWLGAYIYNGEAKWQDDCSAVDGNYLNNDYSFDSIEACFLLADSSPLNTESCTNELPFLCQASTLDIDKCFTSVKIMFDVKKRSDNLIDITSPFDCYPSCVLTESCVGFKYSSPTCTLMQFFDGSSQKKSTLYMRDMIRTTVTPEITASISDLQHVCPSSVAPPSHQTPSITPTQTFSSTTTMTSSTLTGTLMDPSDLESSNPEPLTVTKTTSGSTPPLTSVVTSVNLETTSLPTETEILSMSCSHCACTKSSSMEQEELEESISKLKEQLRVNPKELSSFKRKLTSAPDDRQSAANIGYMGALILCIIPGLIILLDAGRLTREFKQFISHLRNSHSATVNVAPHSRT